MDGNFPRYWMWSEAFEMLARAERLQQHFVSPAASREKIAWEPPVDMLETDKVVLVLVALPGVDVGKVEARIEGDTLVVEGARVYPPEIRTAVIHRLELPQGRFARRVRLPPGRYASIDRAAAHGCLLITLAKAEARHG
jgi:HSP20 family molecular chaperone IbpA